MHSFVGGELSFMNLGSVLVGFSEGVSTNTAKLLFMHEVMSSLLSKLSGNVISTATTFIPFSLLFFASP